MDSSTSAAQRVTNDRDAAHRLECALQYLIGLTTGNELILGHGTVILERVRQTGRDDQHLCRIPCHVGISEWCDYLSVRVQAYVLVVNAVAKVVRVVVEHHRSRKQVEYSVLRN